MSAAFTLPFTVEPRLSFHGLLISERIKLLSRSSTYWVIGIIASMMITLAATMVFEVDASRPVPAATVAGLATGGVVGAQFAAIVLGAFAITGEYRTGQIRSTFNADPRRVRVLAAKGVVTGTTVFLAAVASSIIALVVAHVLLTIRGASVGLFDYESARMMLGAAAYLAGVTAIALAFGAAFRRSAAAITASLVLLWALPGVAVMLPEGIVGTVVAFLPAQAGHALYSSTTGAGSSIFDAMTPASAITLAPWAGLIILAFYTTVIWTIGSAVSQRRDV